MKSPRDYKTEEIISKFYSEIIKDGSKEFISQYDYYLTLFSLTDLFKTKSPKQTEKNFINSIIKEINSKLNIETHLYHLNGLDKPMDDYEHTVSEVFLRTRLHKIQSKKNPISNPHKRIFSSDFAYSFFEQLRQIVTNDLADYSFIYRKMIIDKLIFENVGDSEFRRWLGSNYDTEIDKTKQLHICTTQRKEQLYSTIKNSIPK
jgi:hypothetical protein